MRQLLRALAAGVAVLLLLPTEALGHAQLLSTTPERGAQLEASPRTVEFRFSEAVEISFGSLRVFHADGNQVQSGNAEHPAGNSRAVRVALKPDLPDGTYAATYRVVSADSHPVSGGFSFTVGEGSGGPGANVADLIDKGGAGPVTEGAFGVVRGLAYLAMALAIGGGIFALWVWRPAVANVAGASDEWLEASSAFAGRAESILRAAVVTGAVTSALGIVLQGATAGGTSFWAALSPDVVGDVLATRFGTVWALRLAAWVALGVLLAVPALRVGVPRLRPASLGAAGLALERGASTVSAWLAAALLVFIALTPALAGHATTQSPVALLLPADFAHVVAMSAWVGGLVLLAAAVPAATRRLEAPDRTRLLAATVARFSPVALASVCVLIASGVAQSIVHLSAVADLWETPFGRAVAIKVLLLLALVGLGAYNRQRSRPRLERLAQCGETPGATGVALRRALRAEVALVVAVLGVTAALVSYSPPASTAGGPFSANTAIGPERLELTVDPARVGVNELHLYLLDARTGAQYDGAKEVQAEFSLPEQRVGPLAAKLEKAGPGHYLTRSAELVPAGDWRLLVRVRVSDFDEYRTQVTVPVK